MRNETPMKSIATRSPATLSYHTGVLVGLRMAIVVARKFGAILTPEALEEALRCEIGRIERQVSEVGE